MVQLLIKTNDFVIVLDIRRRGQELILTSSMVFCTFSLASSMEIAVRNVTKKES